MLMIEAEAEKVAAGDWPAEDNPLVGAPHTAASIAAADWPHPYSREIAVYPGTRASDDDDATGSHTSTAMRIQDRKSTRLNSSHVAISYAVFCLKKKKAQERTR